MYLLSPAFGKVVLHLIMYASLAAVSLSSQSQPVYKFKDAAGRTIYSHSPPNSAPVTKVPLQMQSEDERAEAQKNLKLIQEKQLQLKAQQQDKDTARKENCVALRGQIELTQASKFLYSGRSDGSTFLLNSEEKAELIRKMEAGANKACRGITL